MAFFDFIIHTGVAHDEDPPGRGSGRLGWGEGENPFQHMENMSLVEKTRALKLKHPGITSLEIANALGYKTENELRKAKSIEKQERVLKRDAEIWQLYSSGVTKVSDLEAKTGVPGGTIRDVLKRKISGERKNTAERLKETTDMLREIVDHDKFVDVGIGSQFALGVSETTKDNIVDRLEKEGYEVITFRENQLTGSNSTTFKVLCAPGTTKEELMQHKDEIQALDRAIIFDNGNRSVLGLPPVNSIDLNRIEIKYAEDGGSAKDGLIEIKEGSPDLSLGAASYAQVRIGVNNGDNKLYMKGMAAYGDPNDFPPGKDIIFNSSKHNYEDLNGVVLKKMKDDPDNPFGASIKPEEKLRMISRTYIDENGNEKISPINVVSEEGDWTNWKPTLSSQFLSKEPRPLIKQQLDLTYQTYLMEYEDISSIKNVGVKQVLLEQFADKMDRAAVDLKAMSLPRQRSHVILPVTDIADNEIYAPNYTDKEPVILIRYPHAGPFEIPLLYVNNNSAEGKRLIGNGPDAVGIKPSAAAQLSGADYDGDTVTVVPLHPSPGSSKTVMVKYEKAKKELLEFEPRSAYRGYEGMTPVKDDPRFDTQRQMGETTNLIADMYAKEAPWDHLLPVVKHSMVVIDAEKHNLDWKRSEIENDIAKYKKMYQGKARGGASTLITRAKSPVYEDERRPKYIDKEGNKVYEETGRLKPSISKVKDPETGEVTKLVDWDNPVKKQSKTTKMQKASNAYELLSYPNDPLRSSPVEVLYGDFANNCKSLALQSRKDMVSLKADKPNKSAAQAYAPQVESLLSSLEAAQRNAPKERIALLRANVNYKNKFKELDDKDDKAAIKKLKGQCMTEARTAVNAKKPKIVPSAKEWEAIENQALPTSTVRAIVKNCDVNEIMKLALPKGNSELSAARIAVIESRARNGQTQAQIAEALGLSVSTVNKYINSK